MTFGWEGECLTWCAAETPTLVIHTSNNLLCFHLRDNIWGSFFPEPCWSTHKLRVGATELGFFRGVFLFKGCGAAKDKDCTVR